MDYKLYDDIKDSIGYDLFIDKNGKFYRIKKRLDKNSTSHEKWADEYLRMNNINIDTSKFQSSIIFKLSNLKTSTDKLINYCGFVYYSHDHCYYKPIIELPNPAIYGNRVTENQLDTLFGVMMVNNENTNIPIFEGETLKYVCMNDEVDYEENRIKKFK